MDRVLEVLSVGERIKRLRVKKGYTQQQIAYALGVSQGTVAGWERGTSKPSVRVNVKLAEFLGVNVEYFYRNWNDVLGMGAYVCSSPYHEMAEWEHTYSNSSDAEFRSLIDLYVSLNEEGKRRARELMFDLRQIKRYQSSTYAALEQLHTDENAATDDLL